MLQPLHIVDAHLDLAYNATRGRDPRMPAKDQPVVDNEVATVGLPDLRAGGIELICATIFCAPAGYGDRNGYTTAEDARTQAIWQLNWYRGLIEEGLLQWVTSPDELPASRGTGESGPLRAIMLLEGADAMRSPEDVCEWFA